MQQVADIWYSCIYYLMLCHSVKSHTALAHKQLNRKSRSEDKREVQTVSPHLKPKSPGPSLQPQVQKLPTPMASISQPTLLCVTQSTESIRGLTNHTASRRVQRSNRSTGAQDHKGAFQEATVPPCIPLTGSHQAKGRTRVRLQCLEPLNAGPGLAL